MVCSLGGIVEVVGISELLGLWSVVAKVFLIEDFGAQLLLSLLESIDPIVHVNDLSGSSLGSPGGISAKGRSAQVRVVLQFLFWLVLTEYHIRLEVAILSIFSIQFNLSCALLYGGVGMGLVGISPVCVVSHQGAILPLSTCVNLCGFSVHLLKLSLLSGFLLSDWDESLHKCLATANCRHDV